MRSKDPFRIALKSSSSTTGVRAYPPARPGGYWRLRWVEGGRRRDTTARSREEALGRAAEVVEGLARGRPTDWARASGWASG